MYKITQNTIRKFTALNGQVIQIQNEIEVEIQHFYKVFLGFSISNMLVVNHIIMKKSYVQSRVHRLQLISLITRYEIRGTGGSKWFELSGCNGFNDFFFKKAQGVSQYTFIYSTSSFFIICIIYVPINCSTNTLNSRVSSLFKFSEECLWVHLVELSRENSSFLVFPFIIQCVMICVQIFFVQSSLMKFNVPIHANKILLQ